MDRFTEIGKEIDKKEEKIFYVFLALVFFFGNLLIALLTIVLAKSQDDSEEIVYDNIMSLSYDEVETNESYSEGVFLLGFGSYASSTTQKNYQYVTFWYSPEANAYRKTQIIENDGTSSAGAEIFIVEVEDSHYYVSRIKNTQFKYDGYSYYIHVPVGTVKVETSFETVA